MLKQYHFWIIQNIQKDKKKISLLEKFQIRQYFLTI